MLLIAHTSTCSFLFSQAADATYHKLASCMFKWLNTLAGTDAKYTDVCLMENYYHFFQIFSKRIIPISSLQQYVTIAEQVGVC